MSIDIKKEWNRWRLRRATAHEMTPARCDYLESQLEDRPLFQIRPYPGEGGVNRSISFLDDMHRIRRSRLWRNVSESHSFEIWHEPGAEGVLSFNIAPGAGDAASVHAQLMEDLPDSEIRQRTRMFPDIAEGWHAAAARSGFFKGSHYPIRHIDIDGFTDGENGGYRDPYKNVLTKVAQDEDVGVLLQTVFRPTAGSLLADMRRERAARDLRSEQRVTDWLRLKRYHRDPTDVERTAADIIEGQQRAEQFGVSLRLLAWAETPEAAEGRLQAVARALEQYYESHTSQGIAIQPAGVKTAGVVGGGRDFKHALRDTAERWIRSPMLGAPGDKTVDATELAGLVHLPGDGVNHAAIDRSESKSGAPVPNRTPRFDFAAHDIDRHTATPHKKQTAMMTESEAGDPFWVGFGARKGTEAGIFHDILNTHAVIPGRTGVGKTTTGKNLFYQVVNRGYGAVWYDPKGMDADDIIALVPEDREDDVIPIELGGNHDHQVGFNFLSVPGNAEPGSDAYVGALESMADDIEAILPMASENVDESWGVRMSRITRNLCRGLGHLPEPACLLDFQHALASETGRKSYAGRVSEENLRYIEDYANEHLAEMDNDTIEPLAGRTQQLVENKIVRDIISIRGGFDVDKAVAEGKIIVVKDNTSSGTTGRMVAAALIRRIWIAVREQTYDPDQPDPPWTPLFLDEFNEIASANSGIVQVLQDARSFGMTIIAMLQDMDTDLDSDVADTLEGQTETKITYNPGRDAFARKLQSHHSEDIGAQDLGNLSPYTFYMRTRNQQDTTTRSYKAAAFPAIEDVAPEVARPTEAVRELVDRRIREVGDPVQTADEQQDEIIFRSEGEGSESERGIEMDEATERKAVQAVYDTALRDGDPGGYVPLTRVLPALQRRLDWEGSADEAWRKILQHVRDKWLELRPDERKVRVKNPRSAIATVGEGESEGGIGHSGLLWHPAYHRLTKAGLDVTINTSGGATADAVARRGPADPAEPELVDHLLGDKDEARIEAECTTGDQQPGVTAHHICQAIEEDRRVIVLTWADMAHRLENTLRNDPPLCNSGETTDAETWFYTSTATVTFNGNEVCRAGPKGERNVWVRDHEAGEIQLRDPDGNIHGRFDSAEDVFSNPDGYLTEGDCRVKAPVIPDAYDIDTDDPASHATIVTVPKGGDPGDIDIEGYPTNRNATASSGVTPEDLDVPDRAAEVLEHFYASGANEVTVQDARAAADELGHDVSRQTVTNWMNALHDEGALRLDHEEARGRRVFTLG